MRPSQVAVSLVEILTPPPTGKVYVDKVEQILYWYV
jgi:hypothetical protein